MLCAGVGIEPKPPVLWADRTSTEVLHHLRMALPSSGNAGIPRSRLFFALPKTGFERPVSGRYLANFWWRCCTAKVSVQRASLEPHVHRLW